MLCRICIVQIPPRKHAQDHSDYAAPNRQHELDHTDHTDHTDQEFVRSERSRSRIDLPDVLFFFLGSDEFRACTVMRHARRQHGTARAAAHARRPRVRGQGGLPLVPTRWLRVSVYHTNITVSHSESDTINHWLALL